MPKQKNVTDAEVKEAVDALYAANVALVDIQRRINNGNCDPLPGAMDYLGTINAVARDILDLNARLINRIKIDRMEAESARMKQEIERRR